VVPSLKSELIIYLPGYNKREIYINGRESLTISLVASQYKSFDKSYNNTFNEIALKDATYAVKSIVADDIKLSKATSFDQALQGLIPGLNIIEQSGMPGQKTFMSIRGIHSIFAKNEPLLFIDGMIHDYNYADISLMEGYSINPLDIVDIDDIADISVMNNGSSHLGVASSNGVIFINTEQKSETST
jgi:outer membrane cobalamin receptor